MTIRKHLSLLLVILLVFTTASQAASAYIMSCRDTATCCCVTPAMDMSAAMPDGLSQSCCDTTPSQPCDIETATQAAAAPFLSGFVTGSVDSYMAAGMIAIITDPGDVALHMARHSENFPDRGGPPIYLQTQTFLC